MGIRDIVDEIRPQPKPGPAEVLPKKIALYRTRVSPPSDLRLDHVQEPRNHSLADPLLGQPLWSFLCPGSFP